MEEITANVNWIAVIAGFVLSFLLGWLWYSPKLFGTKWAEGVGVDLGAASGMPVAAMVTQAIATFLLAWLVGITAGNNHLATIILVIVAIAVFLYSAGKFAGKSNYAIHTESGFVIVMGVIMIGCQGILGGA